MISGPRLSQAFPPLATDFDAKVANAPVPPELYQVVLPQDEMHAFLLEEEAMARRVFSKHSSRPTKKPGRMSLGNNASLAAALEQPVGMTSKRPPEQNTQDNQQTRERKKLDAALDDKPRATEKEDDGEPGQEGAMRTGVVAKVVNRLFGRRRK